MSPAMIVFAGSSVVGATLRANTRLPPFFGVPAAAVVEPLAALELPELDDPQAASTVPRPSTTAPPWPPRISRSRRVTALGRSVIGVRFRSK